MERKWISICFFLIFSYQKIVQSEICNIKFIHPQSATIWKSDDEYYNAFTQCFLLLITSNVSCVKEALVEDQRLTNDHPNTTVLPSVPRTSTALSTGHSLCFRCRFEKDNGNAVTNLETVVVIVIFGVFVLLPMAVIAIVVYYANKKCSTPDEQPTNANVANGTLQGTPLLARLPEERELEQIEIINGTPIAEQKRTAPVHDPAAHEAIDQDGRDTSRPGEGRNMDQRRSLP